ncbi:MAG: hypothetical protein E7510_08140 [Ruminococcus sp.]|nr:hypothetical protein [Ruminococcus sp.]
MKKLRMLKKVLSMVIATAMIIGTATMVTGCDKKNESGKNSASSSVDAGKTKKIVNYYTSENKGMPEGVSNLISLQAVNGKMYSYGVSFSEAGAVEFYSLDAKNKSVEKFDLSKKGIPYIAQSVKGKIITANLDEKTGTFVYVHDSESKKCETEIQICDNVMEMPYGMTIDDEGNLYVLILKSVGMAIKAEIGVYDPSGKEIKREEITKKVGISGFGQCELLLSDDKGFLYTISYNIDISAMQTGNLTYKDLKVNKLDKNFDVVMEIDVGEISSLTNMFMNHNGNLIICGLDETSTCCYINEVDVSTGEILGRYEIADTHKAYIGSDAEHIIYSDSDAIYSYNLKDSSSEVIYNRLSSDTPSALKSQNFDIIADGEDIMLYAMSTDTSFYTLQILNADGTVEKSMSLKNFAEGATESQVNNCCITPEGNICYLEMAYNYDMMDAATNSEETFATVELYINLVDPDGNKISSNKVPDFVGTEMTYSNFINVDKSGNVYFHVTDDSFENGSCLFIVDKDGNVKAKNTDEAVDEIREIITSAEGDIYARYYDSANDDKPVFAKINAEDGKFGEAIVIDGINLTGLTNVYSGVGENSIYIDDGISLYGYNFESKKVKEIVNWIESDFSESFSNLAIIDENTIACIGNDYKNYDSEPSLLILTKADEAKLEQINNKKVITAAGFEIGDDIATQITKFNKSSDTSRIQVYDYAKHNTADDENKGIKQFNNDIVSGNIPDIVLANTNLNMDIYAKKGMFADLNTFIEKDADIKKEDYLQNIFEIGSYDGKLCQIIPSFTLDGLLGKTSIVGEESNWTVAEFKEFVDSFDGNVVENVPREDLLTAMAGIAMSDYVDFKESKCDFDNEDFITILELIKEIGVEEEVDLFDDENEDAYNNYEKRFWNDECALEFTSISGFSEFNILESAKFKEEVTLKGMPSGKGSGITVRYGESFAISEKSENKDEAWKFVREYLLDDYQNYVIESDFLGGGFPIKLSTIDEMVKKSQDTNNNLYSNYPVGNEMVQIGVISDESVEKVKSILESVTGDSNFDVSIMDIIKEEAELFFKDEATSAETAASIQNKVKLYLDEVK